MFKRKKREPLILHDFKLEDDEHIYFEVSIGEDNYVDSWMFTIPNYDSIIKILKYGCRKMRTKLEIDMTTKMQRRIKQLIRKEVRKSETKNKK